MQERTEELNGQPVFWRELDNRTGGVPTLYLHGVPNSSDMWLPFLGRTGGIAVDLPGFGRSGKRADLEYDLDFYDGWLEHLFEWLELDRVKLVMHDWGAVGLLFAQRFPERIDRLVLIDALPLLPGLEVPRYAKVLRTRGLGEFYVAAMSTRLLKFMLRDANVKKLPDDFLEPMIDQFDQGTQRAILRLYRSVTADDLARAGERLHEIEAPALVAWGEKDPFIGPGYANFYADALGGPARARRYAQAGHWPWLDRPELIDEVVAFLKG